MLTHTLAALLLLASAPAALAVDYKPGYAYCNVCLPDARGGLPSCVERVYWSKDYRKPSCNDPAVRMDDETHPWPGAKLQTRTSTPDATLAITADYKSTQDGYPYGKFSNGALLVKTHYQYNEYCGGNYACTVFAFIV